MYLALTAGFWDWVASVAGRIYALVLTLGGPGLFFLALADSSFLSVPEGNDVLIVVLSTGQTWSRMSYYVAMTIMGSVTGCSLLYSVGRRGGGFIQRRLFKKGNGSDFGRLYRRWGMWAIIVPSILPPPTPFKIFVLSAGIFKVPFQRFFLAVVIGRSIRYFMWGILAVLYGATAKRILEENLREVGTVLFVLFVSAIVGYVIIWLRGRRNTTQESA
jgi:membrane protein YqaA with SNARE-associated domain